MANRRMFSKSIIGSARFLRMPASARLLYYDLGMNADDEGVVEAFSVMRMTGASDDDLRVLVGKQFIRVLNDDLVSVILDWKVNNYLQNDRISRSIYHDLVVRMGDVSGMYTRCIQDASETDTQYSIDKNSIDKDSIEEDKTARAARKPTRHKYGEYQNVLLSDYELDKLKNEFPDWAARIERLSVYIAKSGKSYKSHLAVIRDWARKDIAQAQPKQTDHGYQEHKYTEDDFGADFYFDPTKG